MRVPSRSPPGTFSTKVANPGLPFVRTMPCCSGNAASALSSTSHHVAPTWATSRNSVEASGVVPAGVPSVRWTPLTAAADRLRLISASELVSSTGRSAFNEPDMPIGWGPGRCKFAGVPSGASRVHKREPEVGWRPSNQSLPRALPRTRTSPLAKASSPWAAVAGKLLMSPMRVVGVWAASGDARNATESSAVDIEFCVRSARSQEKRRPREWAAAWPIH